MIPGFSPTRPNSPDAEAHAHAHARDPGNGPATPRTPAPAIPAVALEAIARKVAQLDNSAPVMTYQAWLDGYEGEDEGKCMGELDEEKDDDAVKGVVRASSYVVWYVFPPSRPLCFLGLHDLRPAGQKEKVSLQNPQC